MIESYNQIVLDKIKKELLHLAKTKRAYSGILRTPARILIESVALDLMLMMIMTLLQKTYLVTVIQLQKMIRQKHGFHDSNPFFKFHSPIANLFCYCFHLDG